LGEGGNGEDGEGGAHWHYDSKMVYLLVGLLAGMAAWADTYPRQAGVDIEHYVFRVELSDTTNEVRGETRVDFRVLKDGVAELALDLANTMTVETAGTAGYWHGGDRLRIPLMPVGRAGERRSVTVRYRGTPATGLWIGKTLHGDRAFFSLHWPDLGRQWLPMVDHPYDKATGEFIVTAPVRYQVVANGLLQEEMDLGDGRRRTHWKQGVPIASWLHAMAVGEFSVRHFGASRGIAFSNYVYPQDREKGIATFDVPTRNAFEFFSDFVGAYPYEKLANVQAAGFSGGTEHASVIFYGEKSVTAKPATNLVTHEIAHQWFGNSVTETDWDDVWLSEGFATYFTLLCMEHVEGRDAFVAGLKRSRTAVISMTATLPGVAVIHENLSDMKKVLNRLIYEKGGWTLHMLRGQMGMENFRAGVRDYYQQYKGRNATTEDFAGVMEAHGAVGVRAHLNQWLRRPGVPEVKGSWTYDAAAKQVRVTLRQVQKGEVYRLPVEIGLEDGRVEKVVFTEREQRFAFGVEKAPGAVVLDPNTWVLMKADFEKQ
jgi:aminopeptidase N